MMLVQPSGKEVTKYSRNLPYTVIRNDNSAHVVNDHITGTTAYVCYSTYDGSASAKAFSLLRSGKEAKPHLDVERIDAETIVMERTGEDGRVVMSICTPDLGITQKGYTTAQPSQPLEREVVIAGNWSIEGGCDNVSASQSDGCTAITAVCIDGQPVEFHLRKN